MKKKVSLSSFSHSLQIEKKARSFEKIFSLERSGGSSHRRNQSIKEYLLDRMIAQKRFASKRTKKRARCSSFYTRRLGSLSLSRAREREVSIVSERSLFFSRVIFVSFKVGYAKSEFREKRARAPRKSDEIFSRERVLRRRRKRTHLNLGGLEAGDGRDLLSSSKHYVYMVDVFLCV